MKEEANEKLYTLIAKDSAWFAKVSGSQIQNLMEEKAIEQKENKPNTYQTLYTDKELKIYIKTRDKACCIYCNEKGAVFHWLISKEDNGLETPINLVYTCKECRETKRKDYYEHFEDYIIEATQYRERNKLALEKAKGILCLHCGDFKEKESFKFVSQAGELAYCHDCYHVHQLNVYFLHNEKHEFLGIKKREEIQQLWEEGRIEYLEQNIVKLFDTQKKQRCILCKKMKWKSSFKKNTHKEKKKFCRKCEIENASDSIYTVYNHQHKKINSIGAVEAKKLEKRGIGKIVSSKSFKIQTAFYAYLYSFNILIKEKLRGKEEYFAITLDGKSSYNVTKVQMDALLSEKKAESHNEYVVRLIRE